MLGVGVRVWLPEGEQPGHSYNYDPGNGEATCGLSVPVVPCLLGGRVGAEWAEGGRLPGWPGGSRA